MFKSVQISDWTPEKTTPLRYREVYTVKNPLLVMELTQTLLLEV